MSDEIIENIPIAHIHIANPRARNQQKWNEIVGSIRSIGLKRPITVSKRSQPGADGKLYDLVCGQGRIEAFIALGEDTIPAIVIEASREDRYLMSLVENIARRPSSNRDIFHEVKALVDRGYSSETIAEKLGLDRVYIYAIVHLISKGEESLVAHAEAGRVPITVAIEIAAGNDHEVMRALSEAYQSGKIRGNKLKLIRKIIADYAAKKLNRGKHPRQKKPLTGDNLAQIYQQRVREQAQLIKRYARIQEKLALLGSAMRQLMADENFVTLLRAENSLDMPEALASRLT